MRLKAFRATVPAKQAEVASSVPVMTQPRKSHAIISTDSTDGPVTSHSHSRETEPSPLFFLIEV